MAISNSSLHQRSISLPSTSHPLDASTEDHLRRLQASQAGPSSSSSIFQNLCGIKDLYQSMNDFISLQHNQKALCMGKAEEVLSGSLALLDASSSALEAVSQMKESILDLQSTLRRGNNDDGIHIYLVSRKKIIKMASKCLANLKKAENSSCLEDDDITMRMLKEAEAISLSTLKSVLSFVTGKKVVTQALGWSMVTKLVKSKHVSGDSDEASEVEKVDCTLHSLPQKQMGVETKLLLKQLEALEMVIRELEYGLESVSRCFVKTRVSLLNLLNN